MFAFSFSHFLYVVYVLFCFCLGFRVKHFVTCIFVVENKLVDSFLWHMASMWRTYKPLHSFQLCAKATQQQHRQHNSNSNTTAATSARQQHQRKRMTPAADRKMQYSCHFITQHHFHCF